MHVLPRRGSGEAEGDSGHTGPTVGPPRCPRVGHRRVPTRGHKRAASGVPCTQILSTPAADPGRPSGSGALWWRRGFRGQRRDPGNRRRQAGLPEGALQTGDPGDKGDKGTGRGAALGAQMTQFRFAAAPQPDPTGRPACGPGSRAGAALSQSVYPPGGQGPSTKGGVPGQPQRPMARGGSPGAPSATPESITKTRTILGPRGLSG